MESNGVKSQILSVCVGVTNVHAFNWQSLLHQLEPWIVLVFTEGAFPVLHWFGWLDAVNCGVWDVTSSITVGGHTAGRVCDWLKFLHRN